MIQTVQGIGALRRSAIALAAAAPWQGVYNLGMGKLSSFDDFVRAVMHLYPALQVRLGVQPAGGFAGFPHIRQAPSDLSMAAMELGWRPAYSLDESKAPIPVLVCSLLPTLLVSSHIYLCIRFLH